MAGVLTAGALPLQPGDPQRLGEYEVTGRLGVGEHGAVFLGQGAGGRPVAVKLLHMRLSGEPVARSRFTAALAPARKISGFSCAAVLDAGVEGDRPYVVSELVEGPSLQQLVADEGPRGGAVIERIAVGTAIALAAVHRAGALHLGLKPSNVLLGADGPRVCDFGVARALEAVNAFPAGRVVEDPAYQAPEQLSGSGIGQASDVFAWASTLLFAVTGVPPFGDDSPSEVMQRIVYDDPDLTDLPESLREVVADALAKDPAERPTSAALLERLLEEGGPLAGRLPESMVAEGRALATGTPVPAPVPVEEPAPEPEPEPVPEAVEPTASPVPALTAPYAALSNAPSEADSRSTRQDTPVHDNGATQAMPPITHDPIRMPESDQQSTTVFEAAADPVPGPHIVPGMVVNDPPPRNRTAMLSLPRFRTHNPVLGVALSLTIGVLVGVAIIALVLLPQLRDEDPAPPPTPASKPVTAIPEAFAGTWKGQATNSASGVTFPIEVTFEAGGTTARAIYPRERCNGTLTLAKGTDRALQMTLEIAKPCSAGNIQVTRNADGTLRYEWSKPGSTRGYAGVLRKG